MSGGSAAADLRHSARELCDRAVTLAEARLTDRQRLGVLLQGAGLLSLLEAARWDLAADWRAARIDREGYLRQVELSPGAARRPARERLRDLLLALFGNDDGIAGRGAARRAARELLSTWGTGFTGEPADREIARLFDAAPFLREPGLAASREALVGALVRADGREELWVAGPGAWRAPLLGSASSLEELTRAARHGLPPRDGAIGSESADPATLVAAGRWTAAAAAFRNRPPTTPEGELECARALLGAGRAEAALLLLGDRSDRGAGAIRLEAHYQLGDLGAARDALRKLQREGLALDERLAWGDTALRVLANAGDAEGARDWASVAVAEARRDARGGRRLEALLLAACAAFDRGDRAAARRHFEAAEAARSDERLRARWHEVAALLALGDDDGAAVVEHQSRRLGLARRAMHRASAGRAWNDLGVGHLIAADYARAERAFAHAARILSRCDGPLAVTLAQWHLAEVRLRQGKVFAVEPILDASTAANRRSGNRRAQAQDAALWARYELVRGRPERAVERCREAAAELDRSGIAWHRAELAAWEARSLGLLGRASEAGAALASTTREALSDFEREEIPALFALAGERDRAAAAAEGECAPLWRRLLAGRDVPAEEWPSESRLGAYRFARLVLDAELVAPGSTPRAMRAEAGALFRRLGAARWSALLELEPGGALAALRECLNQDSGDLPALAEFLRAAGHSEALLVWQGPDGDRVLLPGEGGTSELLAAVSGGTLRLAAAEIDEWLRLAFALALRVPLAAPASETRSGSSLVGESPALREALERLARLAAGDLPLLILGESGTGKELAAREVHARSRRAGQRLVVVNCAALAETLVLSELFGHVRGAFTGADRDRAGLFETARGGTIFLDEIGDLPLSAQGNLLRVLQEGEVRRLGESLPRKVDVRVVAATHRDLEKMVEKGSFRQDLFYRLRVGAVRLPPLRERGSDVTLLAEHVLDDLARSGRKPRLSLAGRRALAAHDWPGNVRELVNSLAAAAALAGEDPIEPRHLDLVDRAGADRAARERGDYHREVEAFRRNLVREALGASGGNRAEAARRLGLSRQALSYLARQLGLA